MRTILQTGAFKAWIKSLRDRTSAARINARLSRLQTGHFGDVKNVGEGVSELRFMFGPGYRVYYATIGETVIILLVGGDKGSQFADIIKAKALLKQWKEENNE